MKTSNKVLLIIIIAIFTAVIIATAMVRFNLKPTISFNASMVLRGQPQVTGNGKIVAKSYELPNFDTITVSGNNKVIIKFGDKSQVGITADSNVISYVRVSVADKNLYVKTAPNITINPSQPINLIITMKALHGINTGGVSEIHVANINSKFLTVNLGGVSKCYLSGKVGNLSINSGGVSKIFASKLMADNVAIHAAGVSRFLLHVNNKLNVTMAGDGRVEYSGNPSQVIQHISGAGEIKHTTAIVAAK